MMKKALFPMIAFFLASLQVPGHAVTPYHMVETCDIESADQSALDKIGRGFCAAVVAGAFYTFPPDIAAGIASAKERDIGNIAKKFSCIGGDGARQTAIRLIQVCHCHSNGDREFIENNQDQIIDALKQRAGCK